MSVDRPEIRAALLRRATDSDEITRAEALHGLARRRDERVVPYLIVELPVPREPTTPPGPSLAWTKRGRSTRKYCSRCYNLAGARSEVEPTTPPTSVRQFVPKPSVDCFRGASAATCQPLSAC